MARDPYPFTALDDPEFRREFGPFVKRFVEALEARDKKIKEDAEIFQKEFGIKYCPFHTPKLAEKVKPDEETIKFYNKEYKFTYIKCATWKLCHSNLSFDDGLIGLIKDNEEMIEVRKENFVKCVTCGSNEGNAYFTGYHIPVSRIGEKIGEAIKLKPNHMFAGKEKLYLFERPCHSYLVANFGGLDLKKKK